MTADEHIREVYAYFGLAVYCGQVREHGIVNAMVVLVRRYFVEHARQFYTFRDFLRNPASALR